MGHGKYFKSYSQILLLFLLKINEILAQDISSIFIIQPDNVDVALGGTTVLLCKVNPKYYGSVTWTKDGAEISLNSRYTYVGNQREGNYFLQISNAVMQDSGLWRCKINSTLNSRVATVNVIAKVANDASKFLAPKPSNPIITNYRAFHHCMTDRLLVTLDFPFNINTTLYGRRSKCAISVNNLTTISFFIPYYDCKTLISRRINDSQIYFSNTITWTHERSTITNSFECQFPANSSSRYYTKQLGVFDLAPNPVPYKRTLPPDCPIEVPDPEFTITVLCDWSNQGFDLNLLFQVPFTGKINVSEKGECARQIFNQRSIRETFSFQECGAERISDVTYGQNQNNQNVTLRAVFKNTLYIEQHCTVGSATIRFMRCEFPALH